MFESIGRLSFVFVVIAAFIPLFGMDEASVRQHAKVGALFASHIRLREHEIVADHTEPIPSDTTQKFKKLILHDPSTLLLLNAKALYRFYDKTDRLGGHTNGDHYLGGIRTGEELSPAFNEAIVAEHRDNPLCFLSECIRENCELSRLTDWSYARTKFEQEVVRQIELQVTHESEAGMNIVNVGAGDLFQDLVILSTLLEKNKGIRKINYFCIDRGYETYIKAANNKEVWDHHRFDYAERDIHETHAQCAQLFTWLRNICPACHLHLYVFGSVEEYVQRCETNAELKANVYLGADLDKKMCSDLPAYLQKLSKGPDTDEFKNGHEAYLSAPIKRILKPHGVGLYLTKQDLPHIPGVVNHCFCLLPQDELADPERSTFVCPQQPFLANRHFIVQESYRPQSYLCIIL